MSKRRSTRRAARKTKEKRGRAASFGGPVTLQAVRDTEMNCKSARKLIPAHVDGELDSQKTELLRSHLESCNSCRGLSQSLRRASDALGVVPEIAPAFTMADIRERASLRSQSPLMSLFPPVSRLAATAMAIAAVAGGSVSGVYYGAGSAARQPALTVSADTVATSLGLDAFDSGLAEALHISDAGLETEGQVTQ